MARRRRAHRDDSRERLETGAPSGVATRSPEPPDTAALLHLQRTIGNKATSGLVVQRWNPFKKSKKSKKDDDLSNIVVGAPRNGRVMGEPKEERPPILSMFEFEKDPRRVRLFVEWARRQPRVQQINGGNQGGFDNKNLSEEIIRIDHVLSPFQGNARPPYEVAKSIVRQLRASPDPEIQRVIAEAEAKYRPFGIITSLEGAVASEAVYRQEYGGIRMLAGISGIIHYMGNDLYTAFYETPGYKEALGLPPLPQVPSREGRPALGGGGGPVVDDGGGAPPVPSREGRPQLPSRGGGRALPLPPVPSREGRPQLPSAVVSGGPTVLGQQRTRAKLALQERVDPRETERKVLAALKTNKSVPPDLLELLAAKMAKGQTESRGREVTATTEAQYAEIMALLSPDDRELMKRAARDYTNTSTQINKRARGQKPDADEKTIDINIKNLDEMFQMLDEHGATDKTRISYRLATYRQGQDIPFGSKITVGDVITDKAFVSTSENRMFLQPGSVERTKGTRFVKFTIIGSGGANISGVDPYNNAMGLLAKKQLGLSGFHAVGQAEILYRRNTLFKVESISAAGADVHVVLTVAAPNEVKGKQPKNAFDGSTMA